ERLLNFRQRIPQISSSAEAEPLVDALEQHVLAPTSEAPQAIGNAAHWFIRDLLVHLHTVESESESQRQADVNRLLGILESSPRVSLSFWLDQTISDHWPLELRQ